MSKQVTIHTSDETFAEIDRLFAEAKATNPELTKGQFLTGIVNLAKYSPADQPEPVDMSQYVSIDDFDKLRVIHNTFIESVCKQLNIGPNSSFEEIETEIHDTQQRAMSALAENNKTVEVDRPLDENELRFKVEKLQLDIMQETARRLSAKFGIAVTVADLMVDVTVRYIVERHTEWFFPFVIAPNEFESLTGHKYKQLLLWLKKKPEA